MSKLDMSWLKRTVQSGIAFGRKNAPSIMTGGSILIGWSAVYLFWKESRKADKQIADEEEKLAEVIEIIIENEETGDRKEKKPELKKKEKALIYLKHCWPALAMGLGSSGLAIWAHKMDLSRLAEMYMLTQFLEEKDGKKDDLIEKLKGELGVKKSEKAEDELRKERLPDEEVKEVANYIPGEGRTLIIDETTGVRFRSDVEKIKDGIRDFNESIRSEYNDYLKKKLGGAFSVVSEMTPFPDTDIYLTAPLNKFLGYIGELTEGKGHGVGDLMVFRYDGRSENCVNAEDILRYRDFQDPETGIAAICYLDYSWCLTPSNELMENCPF